MSLNYIKFISTRGVATNVLNNQSAEQVMAQLEEARNAQELTMFVCQEEEVDPEKKAFVVIDPRELFSVTIRKLTNVKDAMKAQQADAAAEVARQRLAGALG